MNTTKKQTTTKVTENKKDKFIDKILENLDKVKVKDWEDYTKKISKAPTNLFTNKPYHGFNVFALYLDGLVNNFKTFKYATFLNISKAGGRLKKGASGCPVEYFTFIYKNKETGEKISAEEVKLMSLKELINIVKIPIVKTYVVFNSEFIENIDEIDLNKVEDEHDEYEEVEEILSCENFISKIIVKADLTIKSYQGSTAFYEPSSDYIVMPNKEFFVSTAKYYSTLFHELIHWTGHESRLKRNLQGIKNKKPYSFEELIAEMGSMLLNLQFGITEEFINSIRYLKSWLISGEDSKETTLRKAFTESKRAKKYLENI